MAVCSFVVTKIRFILHYFLFVKINNNCTFVAEKREVDGLIFVLRTRKLFNVNIVDKTLEERR